MTNKLDQQTGRSLMTMLRVIEETYSADPTVAAKAHHVFMCRSAIQCIARSRYKPALRVLRLVIEKGKDEVSRVMAIQATDQIINGPFA